MTSRRLVVLLLVIACAVPAAVTPAGAWSPRTRVRMVEDARKLMPRALREVLAAHEREIRRGMLTPMTAEGSPEHLPPWDGGTLDAEIADRSARVTAAVDAQEPFAVVALRLGELAHFVADAAFPPLAGGTGDEHRYAHFSSLVDDRLDKIPLVFYGHGDPMLERGDAAGFARTVLEKAREEDSELARAYEAAGPTPHPSAFDVRSVPFAVASLSYSRTVTRIVQAWLDAWQRAHGDLGRTPYLDPDNPPRALDRP